MGTPSQARVADKQEIARRYRKRAKRRPDLSAIRLRELNKLLTSRHGGEVLPDTPDVRRAIVIVAHHLASLPADLRRSIPAWVSLRAPWFTMGETNALVLEVVAKPKRWKAHTLGWVLKLIGSDRKALRITTIGCIDISPAQRLEHRKAEARARDETRRREMGKATRADYLASIVKPKPWKTLGISRRTWYRRGKPQA